MSIDYTIYMSIDTILELKKIGQCDINFFANLQLKTIIN